MQDQPQIPLIETSEVKIPDQLRGLFCEPPLLEGENPDLYWRLLAAVANERKPVTVSDWIAVNDLVTKLWEERGLRRASDALIRGGRIKALQYFLAEVREGEPEQKTTLLAGLELEQSRERSEFSRRRLESYFGEGASDRNEIRALLARYGISEAELHAKAAEQHSDALQMFERMIASRERGRRKLRKEDERRRRRQETRGGETE